MRYIVVRHELNFAVVDTGAPVDEWDTDHGKTMFRSASEASAVNDVEGLRALAAEAEIEAYKLNIAASYAPPAEGVAQTVPVVAAEATLVAPGF